jgi:hypothetical protein
MQATVTNSPTAADYRRMAQLRDRWHTALTGLAVTALAILVFWLLPLPARANGPGCDRATILKGTPTDAPVPCPLETRTHAGSERVFR